MDYIELLDRLDNLDTCAVSDALDALGHPGVVTGICRQSTRQTVAGRVRTLKMGAGKPPGGSTAHLGTASIDEASDTDVIVIEQRTGVDAATWGGVLSEAAHHKHVRGVIVDGAVRDIDEINETGLPVFARSVTPLSARGRIHEVAVNVSVTIEFCLIPFLFIPIQRTDSISMSAPVIFSSSSPVKIQVFSDCL